MRPIDGLIHPPLPSMRRSARTAAALALLAGAAASTPLSAQLRPLEPMDWGALAPGAGVRAQVGGDVLFGQRASIAGVRGRVLEAPAAILSWTTGRVALRAIVHPLRILDRQQSFEAPLPGTTDMTAGRETDAGDNGLETVVRLTPAGAAGAGSLAALRYGVRISTHNDKKGMDRHKTDFYALLGGSTLRGGWTLGAEAGLGVYGTRQAGYDKALPFLYSAGARRRLGPLEPSLALTGQAMPRQIRGNEDLAELRAGLRLGRARWLEASFVRGLTRFSPRAGFILFAGIAIR